MSESASPIVWAPSVERQQTSHMLRFLHEMQLRHGLPSLDQAGLYRWSIEQPRTFWREVWRYCDVRASQPPNTVVERADQMPGARWFPDALLNFAENLLRFRDDHPALIFWAEDRERRQMTYRELYAAARAFAGGLRRAGIRPGDRVAACVANFPEAIIGMLGSAWIGAVWSSCSPDFGAEGIVDRFGQIEPRILVACSGYWFKGQAIDIRDKLAAVLTSLPTVEQALIIPFAGIDVSLSADKARVVRWDEFLDRSGEPLAFEPLGFAHPLYIMFSSGTTGKPKCIVHGAGGTLLEHLKELWLHVNLHRQDRFFYQTTCGWMMWNWLASGLTAGATLVLYDGFPLGRNGQILFDLAQETGITIFGSNAKFLSLCEKTGLTPNESDSLDSVHTVLSTGSPLAPESFDYVYRCLQSRGARLAPLIEDPLPAPAPRTAATPPGDGICLSSISGGTDILGCFALGSPLLPVRRGELQMRSLGLRVEVYADRGRSIVGEKGELVCTAPFPSMPVGFWGDPGNERYRASYFARFPGVWHHGDYVELRPSGGMVFYGRSDAVLNPGGVRIGTAEIYRQVERIPEIVESLAIGQDWQGDVRVVLFVRLQPGLTLDDAMRQRIVNTIRQHASVFHVPKKIIQVDDIPHTRSGKIVELAVRDVIHGRPVKNLEALANPEALKKFANIPELST